MRPIFLMVARLLEGCFVSKIKHILSSYTIFLIVLAFFQVMPFLTSIYLKGQNSNEIGLFQRKKRWISPKWFPLLIFELQLSKSDYQCQITRGIAWIE